MENNYEEVQRGLGVKNKEKDGDGQRERCGGVVAEISGTILVIQNMVVFAMSRKGYVLVNI